MVQNGTFFMVTMKMFFAVRSAMKSIVMVKNAIGKLCHYRCQEKYQ